MSIERLRALENDLREESRKDAAHGANKEWAEWLRERYMASASAKWDAAQRIASLIAELGQEVGAVADDKAAHELYVRWVDSQNIHCNRFPSWGELDEETRNGWRSRVSPHPPRLQAAIDQLNGTTSPAHTSEARDAARYRWLRDEAGRDKRGSDHDRLHVSINYPTKMADGSGYTGLLVTPRGEDFDARVDAAMRQEAGSRE